MRLKNTLKYIKCFSVLLGVVLLLTSCEEDSGTEITGSAPVANFTTSSNSIDIGRAVKFMDQSSNNPTSWLWTFGDGTSSTLQNPFVTYIEPGWYSVSLTVTNKYGNNTVTAGNLIKVGEIDSITDYEGNVYLTIKIGSQWWMAENLKSTVYNDGSPIPHVIDSVLWGIVSTPAYCWYNNDISNKITFGALYNWHAVNTGKLAPAGWHVPSDDEWKQLEMTLGMTQAQADSTWFRGANQGESLKKTSGWPQFCNGTNISGFSALPGGDRTAGNPISLSIFRSQGIGCTWWTSSFENTFLLPWTRMLFYDPIKKVARFKDNRNAGYSVRCVKDE